MKLIFLKLHMLFRGYARSTHDICDMHNICYVTMIPTLCHKDMFLNATNLSLCVLDALIFSPFCCKQGPTYIILLQRNEDVLHDFLFYFTTYVCSK